MVAGSSDGSGTGGTDPRPAGASTRGPLPGSRSPWSLLAADGRPAGRGGGVAPRGGPGVGGRERRRRAGPRARGAAQHGGVRPARAGPPPHAGRPPRLRRASPPPTPPACSALLFVAVSLVWWGSRWLEGRRHPSSAAGLALAAFLVAAAVATLGSEAPGHSAAELARLGTAVLMFFVVDRLCEDTGRPDRVLGAVLAAAVIPVAVARGRPAGRDQPHRGQGPHRAGRLHLLAVEPASATS